MTLFRLLVPAALVPGALLALLAAAPASARAQSYLQNNPLADSVPSPQSIPSSELRNMSAADFQHHIDEEGARPFVRRLIKDIDPHSPEEPNYDIVLEHVAEGSIGWLHAAAEIAPYTDATFSQGIRVAIADALVVNPTGVLNMIGTEEAFDEACGYPFVRQTGTYMLRHKREALAALNHVHQPALAVKKEHCRKQLMDVPTTTASDASRPSTETRN
ncbi:MAG TPA: hypothetical protein VGM02_08875 [Acidobacteriaceae bacterium]|jgi:hypothetical protein